MQRNCLNCNKRFTVYRNRKTHLYCSLECRRSVYMPKYRRKNRKHLQEYAKKYEKKYKERRKNQHKTPTARASRRKWEIKVKYGVTIEQYNKLSDKQNNCCAICGTLQSKLKKALAVDHNHKTGEIRGLLCWNCNIGIGLLKENINTLQNAIYYLYPEERMR